MVWNPWVSQIRTSGKGKALFTAKDMPGLIPDLLVAQEKSIKDKRKDLLCMFCTWYDTVAFIQAKPDEAAQIMSKVLKMKPEEYKVFLPGTRFFTHKDVLATLDEKNASSRVAVSPVIAKGIDASLVREVAKH